MSLLSVEIPFDRVEVDPAVVAADGVDGRVGPVAQHGHAQAVPVRVHRGQRAPAEGRQIEALHLLDTPEYGVHLSDYMPRQMASYL